MQAYLPPNIRCAVCTRGSCGSNFIAASGAWRPYAGDDASMMAKTFLRSYGLGHGKAGLTFAPGAQREMVQDALRRHKGKITAAALELRISRPTLYELTEKLRSGRDF
jgi:hypothetical protein